MLEAWVCFALGVSKFTLIPNQVYLALESRSPCSRAKFTLFMIMLTSCTRVKFILLQDEVQPISELTLPCFKVKFTSWFRAEFTLLQGYVYLALELSLPCYRVKFTLFMIEYTFCFEFESTLL